MARTADPHSGSAAPGPPGAADRADAAERAGAEEGRRRLLRALLRRHGRSFARELGLRLERNLPSHLFRWLCACLLASAPIPVAAATRAARRLAGEGWTTPRRMARARHADLVAALDAAGYARYDERTARMLAATAALALSDYGGDLRRLRVRAGFDPETERRLLTAFPGIGPTGAAIFCREAQTPWPELFPFADARALRSAARLGLPADAASLASLVPRARFPALLAALVRADPARPDETP